MYYYKLAQPHFFCVDIQVDMWVDFIIGANQRGGIRILASTPQDEEEQALPEAVSTDAFVSYISARTKLTCDDLIAKEKVKLNMKLEDYEKFVLTPLRNCAKPATVASSDSGVNLITKFLEVQQEQNRQQNELMRLLVNVTERGMKRLNLEYVKPDMFDGDSSSPESWLTFYEYACNENYWHSDEDKVKNMRLFLSGIAKSWYELRVNAHSNKPWTEWKENFLGSFGENKVLLWDKAIAFKYRSGSALSYFYEKRRLLQLADSALPETSVVPLIIHGLSPDLQKQIQVRGPKTVEELLQGMRNLYLQDSGPQRQPMMPGARCPTATRADERRPLASWKSTASPVSFLTDQGGSSQHEESGAVTKN